MLGIVEEESKASYLLETVGGRYELDRSEVLHRDELPYSMMPDAVFQTLYDAEVRDLGAFLMKPREIVRRVVGFTPIDELPEEKGLAK